MTLCRALMDFYERVGSYVIVCWECRAISFFSFKKMLRGVQLITTEWH